MASPDFGDGIAVVDRISQYSSDPEYWQPMMRDFFAQGAGKTDEELTAHELVDGLTRAVHDGIWGMWLDHREAHALAARAQNLIDTRVGIPDYTDGYQPFVYTGDDVSEGLTAFDTWLHNDHLRHRQDLINDGRTTEQLDELLPELRLVEVVTGGDFYLCIAHPDAHIGTLIAHLERLGIKARRQTLDPWPGEHVSVHYNICEFIEQQLLEHFGFKPAESESNYVRVVDEEHAIVASLSPFERGANSGYRTELDFWLARRDINQLKSELLRLDNDPYGVVALEIRGHWFLDRPRSDWLAHQTSQDQVSAYLSEWIPQLDQIANMAFIQQYLSFDSPNWDEQTRKMSHRRRWSARVTDRMLSGWQPGTDEHLLQQKLDTVSHFPANAPVRQQAEADVAKLRTWITTHPNGIDRKLAD